ncbi:hypothetical protein O181_032414 [Austropuccinia psidii MF-1]|uniref:Uncharacterized protein n=1 Tax=Austropuccinia psidii MF-1 TaxID=1389203 RepID=A0A9Q3H7I1_9BASI|nr:hypothetical protein [Austropuccinia psidii MF-1]
MDNNRFNLASHWEELGSVFQKICLKEIPYKDIMVITKGWNTNMQFKLLEERESRIRENQATIQAIEEQLNQAEPTLIPSGSQGVNQPLPSFLTTFKNQQISSQESQFFIMTCSFQEKTRIKGQKQDCFQPEEERVIPNDPEAFGLGEGRTQDPKIVSNTSDGISRLLLEILSPLTTNIVLFHLRVALSTMNGCYKFPTLKNKLKIF